MFHDNNCSLFLLWSLLDPGNFTVTMHIQCYVDFAECIVHSLDVWGGVCCATLPGTSQWCTNLVSF